MIALVGTISGFHLPQQGIHFRDAELTVGSHCSVTGKGTQQLIAPLGQYMRATVFTYVAQDIACQ